MTRLFAGKSPMVRIRIAGQNTMDHQPASLGQGSEGKACILHIMGGTGFDV
jgi:hypothetical protein